MTLQFTVSESDALAFYERFQRDSKSHQKIRSRARWVFTVLFLLASAYYVWKSTVRSGPWLIFAGVFVFLAVTWCLFYVRVFDASVRKLMRKQLRESSSAKAFGACEVEFLDAHIQSKSPLGTSTFAWSAVDRVVMDSEHLFIFLAGSMGFPIRISEIGEDTARQVHDFIVEHIRLSRE
jgi:hypothetical protein